MLRWSAAAWGSVVGPSYAIGYTRAHHGAEPDSASVLRPQSSDLRGAMGVAWPARVAFRHCLSFLRDSLGRDPIPEHFTLWSEQAKGDTGRPHLGLLTGTSIGFMLLADDLDLAAYRRARLRPGGVFRRTTSAAASSSALLVLSMYSGGPARRRQMPPPSLAAHGSSRADASLSAAAASRRVSPTRGIHPQRSRSTLWHQVHCRTSVSQLVGGTGQADDSAGLVLLAATGNLKVARLACSTSISVTSLLSNDLGVTARGDRRRDASSYAFGKRHIVLLRAGAIPAEILIKKRSVLIEIE